MPELGWRYGYMFFWVLVVAIVGGLFIWLKRKRWI
jgi:magnesium transporter